jgi:O-antigen/teichoic acid export membrane protein
MSSVSNFLVLVLAAHVEGGSMFGSIGLALTFAILVMATARALVGESILVRPIEATARPGPVEVGSVQCSLGVSVLGALVVLVGVPLAGGARWPAVVLAASFPGLILLDLFRNIGFGLRKPMIPLALDLGWLVLFLGTCGVAAATGRLTPAVVWAGWCVPPSLVLMAVVPRYWRRVFGGALTDWWARYRDLVRPFLGAYLVTTGATYGAQIGLSLVVDPDSAAMMRGLTGVFGVIAVLYVAAGNAFIPRLARMDPSGPAARRTTVVLTLGLVLCSMLVTVVLVALPTSMGELLFGSEWARMDDLLIPFGLYVTLGSVSGSALLVLRAFGCGREVMWCRVVLAPVQVVIPLAAAVSFGMKGFVYGLVAMYLLAIPQPFWYLAQVRRARRSADPSTPLSPGLDRDPLPGESLFG